MSNSKDQKGKAAAGAAATMGRSRADSGDAAVPDPPLSAPSLKSILSSEGYEDRDDEFEEAADKALKERPYFSFRLRLFLSLSVVFVMALVVILWSVNIMSELANKIDFLEVVDKYAAEIQQARRFEKNFLLYGEGIDEALAHTHRAQRLVAEDTKRFEKVVGRQVLPTMEQRVAEYEMLLRALRNSDAADARKKIEVELRDHGADMVAGAFSLTEKERKIVENRLALARLVPFVWLGALLLVLVLIGYVNARGVLSTLHRFVAVTDRIGAGDFTPVWPGRRIRDEFTDLALHINNMVRQLDRQHRILVESHKLRAMGTLVAGVAHELNNPLNNMMLTSAVLEEEYAYLSAEEQLDMIRELVGETERARAIVHNLLDFARESDAQLEALRVKEVVDETVALVANQAKVKKVRLWADIPEELPPIHGDRQLLRQVFMNLLLNAIDALQEGGKVYIGVTEEEREGFVGVDFTDNGPGIPDHVMDRIFDPFFTTKPQGKGTGLGLSVSRGIVRKLGGYLLVASELGKGTTFTVLLPVTGLTPQALRGKG